MASDKPSPVLLDAVKAQASKLRETKNALDARGKELEKLRAELDARTAALENQAARLKAERDDFSQERDQVVAARSSMDKDIAGMRMEREKASAAQHDSFVELQTTLKDELYHLASEREKLALKEKSLLEAEKYITAALEASGIEMPEEPETKAPPPPPTAETRPPRPPQAQASPPAPAHPMEPLRDELFEQEPSAAKPRVP